MSSYLVTVKQQDLLYIRYTRTHIPSRLFRQRTYTYRRESE